MTSNKDKKYKQRRLWSLAEEKSLVELWEEKIEEFRANRRTSYIYNEITNKLRDMEIEFTPEEVKIKIHNLTNRYKQEVKSIDPLEGPPSQWHLFQKIHRILGGLEVWSGETLVQDNVVEEDEVVRLLHLWGLSDLKAKFKANYIVRQALEFLTEEDIVDLIPKIGQRAIFRGRLLQWRQQNGLPSPHSLPSCKTKANPINIPEPETEPEPEPEPEPQIVPAKVKEPTPPPAVKISVNPLKRPLKPKLPDEKPASKPCIQSKVQKFYISPVGLSPSSPIPMTPPTAALLPSHITAPDLTPFVTSIIRVETNCDKKNNSQASDAAPPAKVNRTRILQKIKHSDKSSTQAAESSPRSSAKPAEPKQKTEESQEEQYEETQPDARHLYPIIKLETETADTSWNDYSSEPEAKSEPEPPQQVITKREPEEVVADSTDFQAETLGTFAPDFYNETDNPLLKLEQMTAKDIQRPRRKRVRVPRKFDIRNILMNSRMGRHVLRFYEKNDRLDTERRRMLIDAIIQDCWTTNRHISPNNCIAIAMEIVRVLPNEKMDDYFQAQTGKNPKSPLYNKYRNMRRRFFTERKGLAPPTAVRRRNHNALTQGASNIDVDDIYIIS